ncbi:23S rRNA (pseudouridine(1915)-N(3))-methyltransferase RlmH [Mesoplasma corruscae]|uniref:Ribosomal RNA large subunit methyltransferase H n=1 Tax=Mesoplasma corruscae TaxID=216874 RepID=A0A2S5RG51_9MOLU|nr:23S rRNA (pseudouridine(1915)-N(3))-methyltransferase RlmH [Mesoplasma corruscae]PPE06192.1 rRNA large subunit methyltransferase [Mesoplasma corruscae]
MDIKILCFGSLDKDFFIKSFNEYQSRIKNYSKFEVIELKEEFNKEEENNKIINSKAILEKLKSYSEYEIICLNVNSKIVSSEELANIINNNKNFKRAKLLFLIGPSDGFSKELLEQKFTKISLGNITLPYQLFRIILAEQIYRSFKIIKNEKYHK